MFVFACTLLSAACAGELTTSEPPTAEETSEVNQTIADFEGASPGLKQFIDSAYGYVVFPSIGKGGLIIAGAHGNGWVYERGVLVGQADMSMMSFGAQIGGESYGEILCFRDKHSMDAFKAGKFELGAEASAVMIKAGAAAKTGYDSLGHAVFVKSSGGAMASASVGGQKMSFEPLATGAVPAQ